MPALLHTGSSATFSEDRLPEDDHEPTDPAASLANRSTVRDLVAAYEECAASVRGAFAQLVAAEDALNARFTLAGHDRIRIDASRYGYHDSFDDPEACLVRIRRQCWEHVVDKLELRRMLSIARWTELQKHLKDGELPEITEASVAAFAQQYAASISAMWREAVTEVFHWLRPGEHCYAAKYKTNAKLEVGPRVVLTSAVELGFGRSRFRIAYYSQQKFSALERVFQGLDGRGQASKAHTSLIENALAESKDGRAETEYFAVRAFKNGNLHLEFRRPDLLAAFNALAGGRNLRPGEAP